MKPKNRLIFNFVTVYTHFLNSAVFQEQFICLKFEKKRKEKMFEV